MRDSNCSNGRWRAGLCVAWVLVVTGLLHVSVTQVAIERLMGSDFMVHLGAGRWDAWWISHATPYHVRSYLVGPPRAEWLGLTETDEDVLRAGAGLSRLDFVRIRDDGDYVISVTLGQSRTDRLAERVKEMLGPPFIAVKRQIRAKKTGSDK